VDGGVLGELPAISLQSRFYLANDRGLKRRFVHGKTIDRCLVSLLEGEETRLRREKRGGAWRVGRRKGEDNRGGNSERANRRRMKRKLLRKTSGGLTIARNEKKHEVVIPATGEGGSGSRGRKHCVVRGYAFRRKLGEGSHGLGAVWRLRATNLRSTRRAIWGVENAGK